MRAASTPLGPLERWLIAGVAALVMMVSYVDRQTLAIFGPSVTELLGKDADTKYGLIHAAFSIAYLVGAPIAGILVDRYGARVCLLIAVMGWSIASAAHTFASSFWVFFLLRIALGTMEAPSFPGATQVVRRTLLPRERATGYGMVFSGSFVGAMIAGPLALALMDWLGSFQAAFLGTAALGLLWVPLFVLTAFRRRARAALDTVDPRPEGVPIGRLRLLRQAAVLRATFLVFLSAPAIMFTLLWLPKFLHDVHAVAQGDMRDYTWLPCLLFDAAAIGFGFEVSRRERRRRTATIRAHADLVAIGALLASTLAILPLVPSPSPWTAVGLASVSMAGGGILYTRLTADMLARVDPAHVSLAGGLTAAAQSIAYVLFNPLVGKLHDDTGSYSSSLIVLGLLNIPGAIVWMLWPVPAQSDSPAAAVPSPADAPTANERREGRANV